MLLGRVGSVFLLFVVPAAAWCQALSEGGSSRLNSFGLSIEYSNDSSHILLGSAVNRKIAAIGVQYERRLLHRRGIDLFYAASLRPAMIESDPMESIHVFTTLPTVSSYDVAPLPVLKCVQGTVYFSGTLPDGSMYSSGNTFSCGRRQVFAQALSPIGFRMNLGTRRRLQPTGSSSASYIFSTQQVPVTGAGSFNFVFDVGVGLELYQRRGRSIRMEYLVQHYSNKKTGDLNPGVDNGFVKLTYLFGR